MVRGTHPTATDILSIEKSEKKINEDPENRYLMNNQSVKQTLSFFQATGH
jgi:hypothetical protein